MVIKSFKAQTTIIKVIKNDVKIESQAQVQVRVRNRIIKGKVAQL